MQWISHARHDVYHTSAYHLLAEERGEGEAYLAVYGAPDRFVAWPYLLRRIEGPLAVAENLHDIASVYGYSGPLFHSALTSEAFLEESWKAIKDVWQQQNAVTAFTRFHPLLHSPEYLPNVLRGETSPSEHSTGSWTLTRRGHTVSIDLSRPVDSYKRSTRQSITRCLRMGFTTAIDDRWDNIEAFASLYRHTMIRNRASPYYLFDVTYFDRLRALLGSNAFLIVVRAQDQVISGGAILAYGDLLHLHLGGTRNDYLAASPFKLLIHDLHRWGRERGYRSLHMGGGRGSSDNDELFRFKASFSDKRHVYCTGNMILDSFQYRRLCEDRRHQALASHLEFTDSDYLYRAPLTAAECV
jgi:hypothetical protein